MAATEGLRLSQFYNQIVGTPSQSTGCVTASRLYADVLISSLGTTSIHNESVNQSLNLSHSAGTEIPVSANNTLNFASVAAGVLNSKQVTSTLTLADSAAAARDIPGVVASALTLVSLGGRVLSYTVNSSLNLASLHSQFNYVDDRKPCGNVLVLTDSAIEKNSRDILHDLGLVQTVNIIYPIKPHVIQPIGITDHTSTPHRAFMSDFVYLTQSIGLVLPTQHVTSTINFSHDSPIGRVDQTLNLTQTVNFAYLYELSQNVSLTDSHNLQATFVRTVEHSNFIGHSLTWYEDSDCGRKQYTPFQGDNTIPSLSEFTPPSVDLQDPQGDTGNFSLYTPYLGVATSKVTLRNPEMDNRDRNAYTRVNNETRGGKLIVFSDPQWPNIRTLAVTITGLTETEVDSYQDFMKVTLGEEIGLTDWEGRLWKGVITNPNEAATQDGRARWTVTFELEGEMLEVEQPGNDNGNGMAMNLSQSATAVIV